MTQPPIDITPVLTPIIALLKSRKFIVALAGLMGDLIVLALPTLQPMRDQLVGIISIFALSIIGTTAAEDISKVHASAKVQVAQAAAPPAPMPPYTGVDATHP